METTKLQFNLRELADIKFSLLIAADECRKNDESALSDDLILLYDRINEYLTPFGL